MICAPPYSLPGTKHTLKRTPLAVQVAVVKLPTQAASITDELPCGIGDHRSAASWETPGKQLQGLGLCDR